MDTEGLKLTIELSSNVNLGKTKVCAVALKREGINVKL
jgi:hypothetical protein